MYVIDILLPAQLLQYMTSGFSVLSIFALLCKSENSIHFVKLRVLISPQVWAHTSPLSLSSPRSYCISSCKSSIARPQSKCSVLSQCREARSFLISQKRLVASLPFVRTTLPMPSRGLACRRSTETRVTSSNNVTLQRKCQIHFATTKS